VLRDVFGHKRLRAGQREVIERVLARRSTLAIMPTGAGKSLCYQLPACLLTARTVVVSPLIALMKDQADALSARGVACAALHSGLGQDEEARSLAAIADGSARVVLTTPERLSDPQFLRLLARRPTALLAVGEAHCLSQWGHDFRPAFLAIALAVDALGRPPVLALTATASERVVDDVCAQLAIPRSGVLRTGVYRANLHFAVDAVADARDKPERLLAHVLQDAQGSGIVYTATIKAAEEVHAALRAADVRCALYHGRLGSAQRQKVQDDFMAGRCRVLVATNAFGLGIDKPDIRFVLHYQMPASLATYYQEAGRAGRDGAPARCTLVYLHGDRAVQRFFLSGRYPSLADIEAVHRALLRPPPDGGAWTMTALQTALERPASKLRVALAQLRRQGVVGQSSEGALTLLRPELHLDEVHGLVRAYAQRREDDLTSLEAMVYYAQTGRCRWQVLLEHFEPEHEHPRCGHCDTCQALARNPARGERANDALPSATATANGTASANAGEGLVCAAGQPNGICVAPEARTSFSPGDRVRARRYGQGVVVQVDALSVTVRFADGSERCFAPAFITPLPPRRRRTRQAPALREQAAAAA
jgi:ATP-dependent DNA helicase RecQ